MSFCRWSSDNWQCDLYCYEHVDGFIATHVAGRKHMGDIPKLPNILSVNAKEYLKAYKAQMKALDKAKLEPIGLPYDGQFFEDDDYTSFLNRLYHLREAGYRFPDYVIDEVKEIIASGRKPCNQ